MMSLEGNLDSGGGYKRGAMSVREAHYDEDPIIRSDSGIGEDFASVAHRRLSRRDLMKAGLALALGAATLKPAGAKGAASAAGLSFVPISPSTGPQIATPPGYDWSTVARWGDAIRPGGAFTPGSEDSKAQENAFGYNADYVGYLPMPYGSEESRHGLLVVNNEYVNPELMFPSGKPGEFTEGQVRTMIAAVGLSVIEIKQDSDRDWGIVENSRYNRRLTADTPMEISGPARGSSWMKTKADPKGEIVLGTLGNCSAGKTPWGTVLSAEENIQDLFGRGKAVTDPALRASYDRYGIPDEDSYYGWEHIDPRFRADENPNEPMRFGWVVEVDPYDPEWTPVKRTSLGRFRHEAATTFVTRDQKVVMYSGDDAQFEYVYKFVCDTPYNAADRKANRGILDEGTLFVGKFNEDGTGEWMPLVQGQGPLTPANGFRTQADVVVNVRIAADLLGATKMDRPEDMEVNPVNKKLYIACTNNTRRGTGTRPGKDSMNPRNENRHGHVIEVTEAFDDHASHHFAWEHFLVCGDPEDPETYFAGYPKDRVAAISCPDNLAFDNLGNLWIATDGMSSTMKVHDGLFAVAVSGPERGLLKQFMACVPGAEVCGPEMTPDNKTLFLAIQHPGEGSTFGAPSTSWPGEQGPPRPSVIAIRKRDGGIIGS